ncbi:Annexin A6 [Desmophyllum pertusum]|uniref:Annexin n=1 Tax=Desmophyllum pertusum TaxID=174260 RepID=A0A9X0CMD8_9CNID|nr:Annexin A6 [Desmophyllum pertusum]
MDNWQKIVERTQRELKEANDRISSLEEDLQKTTGSASSQLDTIASLEQHLKEARTAESEAKQRVVEEELKKKVASLEEALAKANNDLGKSQESLDSLNSSPDKKKKGIKGAFNKVMSKKDKEEMKQLEEAQRRISIQQTEIDDLKNAREVLEKQNKALEVDYKELKRQSISVEAELTKSQQIEKDIVEAMSETALSPVKPRLEHTPKPKFHGTLKPADNFDAEKDAEALRKAMQGSGSDKDAIVAVLGARSNKQRQEIAAKYQHKYSKNLTEDLKSELSGKFEDAAVALMAVPEFYDATSLHDAMSGIGTDEQVLIEILCSRTYEELQVIKNAYTQIYSGKDVLKKIKEDTGGEFRTTLMNLIEKKRDSSAQVKEDLAKEDAKKLHEAGQGKKGADKAVFIEILTTRNHAQLRATFDAYKTMAKRDLMDYISEQLTGDLRKIMEAIVRCAQDPPLYFTEVLEKRLTSPTNDLAEIKTQYAKKTGQPLKEVVVKKMKGDLEKILLQLLGN